MSHNGTRLCAVWLDGLADAPVAVAPPAMPLPSDPGTVPTARDDPRAVFAPPGEVLPEGPAGDPGATEIVRVAPGLATVVDAGAAATGLGLVAGPVETVVPAAPEVPFSGTAPVGATTCPAADPASTRLSANARGVGRIEGAPEQFGTPFEREAGLAVPRRKAAAINGHPTAP